MSLIFTPSPASGRLARWLWWLRPAVVVLLLCFVGAARPHPALAGRGLLILLAMAATAIGWLLALWIERRRGSTPMLAMLAAGVAGALLALASPSSPAQAFPFIASGVAGALLPLGKALYVAAASAVTVIAGVLVIGAAAGVHNLVWITPVFGLVTVGGAARRSFVQRAEQAELLLAEAERTRAAETHAAALAERARIARDLHDVLAHSVAALAMQLEAADALLASGAIERAHETVLRARQLARDGLLETRRAVSALRDDDTPLPAGLRALARGHGASATVTVTGAPRELPPDIRDALYRAAQEALTNVRKHAPGTAVAISLAFRPRAVALTVRNGPPTGAPTPLSGTGTGSGLGLVGMRERAAALGGSAEAGPDAGGWLIQVTIPT